MEHIDLMLVIDFYQMWWLLKEPFLATYSAMSNPHSTKQGAVAPKRAVLILGCSTFSLHHRWNCLVQNMIDVFCTLLRRDFPWPELFDAVHQLLFVAWLNFRLQKELEFVPQVLDRVEIRAFCRRYSWSGQLQNDAFELVTAPLLM